MSFSDNEIGTMSDDEFDTFGKIAVIVGNEKIWMKNVSVDGNLLVWIGGGYAIKVASPSPETAIYQELGNTIDKVVKHHNIGRINTQESPYMINCGQQVITISDTINETMFSQINSLGITDLTYIVMEAIEYGTLWDIQDDLTPLQLGTVLEMTMKLLLQLNSTYGFIHWDLWGNNLFVKVDDDEIDVKLYDFDNSETRANRNQVLLKKLYPSQEDVDRIINFHSYEDLGFVYDIIRLVDSINMCDSKCQSTNPAMQAIFDVIYEIQPAGPSAIDNNIRVLDYCMHIIDNVEIDGVDFVTHVKAQLI